MNTYMIVKKIKVDAETLEEAIANHNKGTTVFLNADVSAPSRPTRPSLPLKPPQIPNRQIKPPSLRNPRA